jgi:hypothetical protein
MAATLEIKYFNSFWLKKMKKVTEVVNTTGKVEEPGGAIDDNFITLEEANTKINVGQKISWSSGVNAKTNFVYSVDGATIYLTTPLDSILAAGTDLTFGPLSDFTYIPAAYAEAEEENEDWYIEEARIRGGYNNTTVDFGVKAYIVDEVVRQQHLANSMIYSGIFNSRTGINRTNEFSVGADITKAVDPANGSIQKLFAEDTNLIIFQEGKVSQALIDKNAIYSAEGSPITTSSAQVIGQIQAYGGNYGISTNPESFATYGYRKYFTDRTKNAVLRLSQDGITEISAYGMLDYFRDNLSNVGNSGFVVGGWDMHNKQYILSMQFPTNGNYETLAFDEDIKGWVSRYTYKPEAIKSLRNETFTFSEGNIWRHYVSSEYRGSFYGDIYNSNIEFVFNPEVSGCKTFNTINYEGTNGWQVIDLTTDTDTAVNISYSNQVNTLANLETQIAINNFKKKENKYFANIVNNTAAGAGDVVFGQSMSGIKGYYGNVSMLLNNSTFGTPNSKNELFAVSLGYVESSY